MTSARHDVFNFDYATQYPDSFDSNTPEEFIYVGLKSLTDPVMVDDKKIDIGRLVLSPTRTYLPVLKQIINELRGEINGLIHCTGGAQTKVQKFIKNKHVIKDNLFPVPPLFEMIQQQSGTSYKEMYQVFNMGHRLEFYLPEAHAQTIIDIAENFNINAQIIGRVEAAKEEKITIFTPDDKQVTYS